MYRCEDCLRITEPGEPQQLIVESRVVDHPRRKQIYWRRPRDGEKGKWIDDPGGVGTQITRERRVCADCHAKALAIDRQPPEPTVGGAAFDVVPDDYGA